MCFRPAGAARVMQCPQCGGYNKPDATECKKCGYTPSEEELAALAGPAPAAKAPGNAPVAPGNAPVAPGAPKAPTAPAAPGAPKPPESV
ncbi:MAG: hypothetical protein LBG97_02390 [Coriobacteriales bacterium]|jgi:hypothetical protein|nr:hypothetical protein [Coriobacteriales bacterium]